MIGVVCGLALALYFVFYVLCAVCNYLILITNYYTHPHF
jgi:hypothetical protein